MLSRDLAGHKSASFSGAAVSNGEIDAFGSEIDHGVAEAKIEFEPGMIPRQFQQHGLDAVPAKENRQGYSEAARNLSASGVEQRLAQAQFLYRPQAALVIDLSILRQTLAPRRPMEKTDAEPCFKTSNGFANRRPREGKPIRCPGKAACFNCDDEDRDAIKIVPHRSTPIAVSC